MQNQNQYCDKEILSDVMMSEKQMTSTCNTWAGECVNEQLRNAFLNILDDNHRIQNCIFKSMQTKGWYQTEQADQQKVTQTKQQLTAS